MRGFVPDSKRCDLNCGFTAVELVAVLSMAALILGGLVVGFGTLVRSRPTVASFLDVPLGSTVSENFYGNSSNTRATPVAPHYGMMAVAENLREVFYNDVISATAVFCLSRNNINTYRPSTIPYNPLVHGILDTPQQFRAHLVTIGVSPMPFIDYRNPLNTVGTVPTNNASIFVLQYSKFEGRLKVLAIYDIDVIRLTNPANPQGFHASVKRYADDKNRGIAFPLIFAGGYDVFYPPSIPNPNASRPQDWINDGFTPIYITFERASRLSILEGATTDRFKLAAERPFYFIWWPDPGARHLGPQPNTLNPQDPRQAYNHMAGRTAFMFTVPMFPAL